MLNVPLPARLIGLLLFFVALGVKPALGQLPATRLDGLFPAGAQVGTTLEVTISGADLDDVNQLAFSHAGITAKPKMAEPGPFDQGPQPVANTFVVTVAGNVPIGCYEARVTGKYGVSNPRLFAVGDLAEVQETEPNNRDEEAMELTLPVVINGQSNPAADVDFFKFKAAANQRIILSCQARRIDSRMDSVVTVYDAAGRLVQGNRDDQGLDSLVDFTTSAAGEYLVKVHDSSYQGGANLVYRLRVGVLPHIDFVMPPAGAPGGNRPLTIYGRNLPGGKPSGLNVRGRPLESVSVSVPIPAATAEPDITFASRLDPSSAGLDVTEYRIKGPQGVSNPVLIGVARATLVAEAEPNNDPAQGQKLTVPCEVAGQFHPQRDRDWYQLEAKQGEAITVEVIAQRMGVRCDPSLLVQRVVKPAEGDQPEQVQRLAFVVESGTAEGGPQFVIQNDDPVYHFVAPADGSYRLMVRDSFSDVSPDPRRVYRLAIHRDQPDFRLAAVAEDAHHGVLIRKGGQVGIRVVAFRRNGFQGEIKVTATGLPAGVTCADAIIGPESHAAMLLLSAAANAAASTAMIQVQGKSTVGTAEVTRSARFAVGLQPTIVRQQPNQRVLPVDARVSHRRLAVTVAADETSPVTLLAGDGKVWETSRSGKIKIPYNRGGAFKGAMTFMARGLPSNTTAPVTNIAANAAKGEFEITLRSNTPTGTYTFYLDAVARQVDYERNPAAAAAAAARKKEVDQLKVKADADAKAAATAKAATDKAATDASNQLKAAETAKTAADQALAAAMTAAKTATQKATQAKAAAAAQPDNAGLKTAATNAAAAAAKAAEVVKTAMTKVTAAQKAVVEAQAKAKTAADAKLVADQKASDAAELAKQAAALKVVTDKRATDTANAAKKKKINVSLVSNPVTLKVASFPLTLAEPKPPGPLKQGMKLEVPITITRLYDYKGAVNFNVALPSGVGGISIPNVSIPANQNQAKFTITAAANATVGEHVITVRGTHNVNGQNLVIEQPLRLTITKATPAP